MAEATAQTLEVAPACPAKAEPETVALLLIMLAVVFANIVAVGMTMATVNLMGGVTPFAQEVLEFQKRVMPYYRPLAYCVPLLLCFWYLLPVFRYLRAGCPQPTPTNVQTRTVNGPLVVAALGFSPWLAGLVIFPLATIIQFGHWSTDLASQQVLAPLVNGFLAATSSYLLLDGIFRRRVVRRVFPEGRLADVPGSLAFSVRGRLLIFLVAVAFIPLFSLLGLVQAAAARLQAGMPVDEVMTMLTQSSWAIFALYIVLGIVLTLLLARTVTGPLEEMVAALRRLRRGETEVRVSVTSSDELGVLEDGVNAMVDGLQERERILQTFGRVVEPSVRDRLLAGEIDVKGNVRVVSVLFCDLRGFTTLAEQIPAGELVTTLNEYFTTMTTWVRECGGFVDKFIGDAILVVFGLFENDAQQAPALGAAAGLTCALGMRVHLEALNARRAQRGKPPLSIKIGLHTGEVVAGTIGARDRHEYTVIGDTVNIASRLERLCKENGYELLVSENTLSLARGAGVSAELTRHEAVLLRGRSQPVSVYGV